MPLFLCVKQTVQNLIQQNNSENMSVNIQSTCRKVLSTLSFMLLLQFAHAQLDFTGLEKKLDAAKNDIGKNYVCLIYKDGKIIYKKETEGFDARTQASIGAASKWLVAALVMTYVDQGKLSLDDKVSMYLPIFKNYRKSFITIRQCLSEITGIKPCSPSGASLEEVVSAYANKCDIETNPGTELTYNNIGINIAARVCEVVAKRGFEQIMNERIIRPLGMRNTSFFSNGSANPSGGATSSAGDYINFLSLFLNKGLYNAKEILSEKSLEELAKVQTSLGMIKTAPKLADGYNYALASWVQEADINNKAITLSCPSLGGTYPWVDKCRGYAAIIFTKNNNGDGGKANFTEIKHFIDGVIGGCK